MLEARGLNAFYGPVQVLWDLNLVVRPGQVVAVIGPNGAGKSTLLKAITGLVSVRGTDRAPALFWEGQALDGLKPEEVVSRGIALVPEGGRAFPEMTCEDNLKVGAHLVTNAGREKVLMERVFDLFPRLAERRRQKASTLSGGERQMLAVGRALMSDPKLLLLDEPSLGLHPKLASSLFAALPKINQEGVSLLLVEQKVAFALEISSAAYVLENGRISLEGPGPELLRDEHVRKAYLAV